MPTRVSFGGESWLTDDLTLNEAIQVEKATGESWVYINPFRSAEHAKAIIAAFVARTRSQEEAEKLVGALSVKETLASIEDVADDLPAFYDEGLPDPKAGDTATT